MYDTLGDFNLTLEILEGCGHNCNNCAVDKSFQPLAIPEEDVTDLLAMVDSLQAFGLRPFEYTLGATDIITASNGMASLEHPLVTGLAERFTSLVVSLALLNDRGLAELAQQVDQVIPEKNFRLIVPATIANLQKPKYLKMLKARIEYLRDALQSATFYRLYLTINAIGEDITLFTPELDRYIAELDLGVHMVVDYSFAHSRKGLENLLMVDKLKRDVAQYIDAVQQQVGSGHARYLIPDVRDGIELLYRDRQLYYVPILLEKFPIFNEQFVIPKPWTAETVLAFKEQLYVENLTTGAAHPTCGDCCYLDNCSRGDPRTVMRYIGYDHCIINMKNRWDLITRLSNGKPPCSHLHPVVKERLGLTDSE